MVNLRLIKSNKAYYLIDQQMNSYLVDNPWDKSIWSYVDHQEPLSEKISLENLKEAPVDNRITIYCIGKNYAEHAKEMGSTVPSEPLVFLKPASSILEPQGVIILPEMSDNVHYETELVVVIGKKAKNVTLDEAGESILGYTIGLDITARDLQKSDTTWFRAKGFDTFAPIGPWIVPFNEIDPQNLDLVLEINEKVVQTGNTSNMIFNVKTLISYLSKIVTLYPGDIIFTGTPSGVGPIHSGDVLVAKISGIGELKVSVK